MHQDFQKNISFVLLFTFTLSLFPLPAFALRSKEWVDFKVGFENTKGKGGSGKSGSSSKNGSSGGSTSGTTSGANGGIATNSGNESKPKSSDDSSGNPNKNNKPKDTGNSDLVTPPFWMPLCFFFDSKYDEEYARNTIKTVVDDWGQCGIAVQVHSFTIRPGTYTKDEPVKMNQDSDYHCDYKGYYKDPNLKGATQTHPDSIKASDIMCDEPDEVIDKEKRVAGARPYNRPESPEKVWSVGGCAKQPGNHSIVDLGGGGGTASHEFGHNVGNKGQGGDELENEGEKNKTGGYKVGDEDVKDRNEFKTSAGRGLQLKNERGTRLGNEDVPEGSESKSGYTTKGCLSLRGGANDNTVRKFQWDKTEKDKYYKKETLAVKQIDYDGRGKPALPPRPGNIAVRPNGPGETEETGRDRMYAGDPRNADGYRIRKESDVKGGHPPLQSGFSPGGFAGTDNSSATTGGASSAGTVQGGPNAGKPGTAEPAFTASITYDENAKGDGNKNDASFFNSSKPAETIPNIASTSSRTESSGRASEVSTASGDDVVVTRVRDKIVAEEVVDPLDPNYLLRSKAKAKVDDVANRDRTNLKRKRLTDPQSKPIATASVSGNESAPKGESIMERRTSSQLDAGGLASAARTGVVERRAFTNSNEAEKPAEKSFSASSDPALSGRRKNSSRRTTSDDANYSRRRSGVEQTPTYSDSSSDFGD